MFNTLSKVKSLLLVKNSPFISPLEKKKKKGNYLMFLSFYYSWLSISQKWRTGGLRAPSSPNYPLHWRRSLRFSPGLAKLKEESEKLLVCFAATGKNAQGES